PGRGHEPCRRRPHEPLSAEYDDHDDNAGEHVDDADDHVDVHDEYRPVGDPVLPPGFLTRAGIHGLRGADAGGVRGAARDLRWTRHMLSGSVPAQHDDDHESSGDDHDGARDDHDDEKGAHVDDHHRDVVHHDEHGPGHGAMLPLRAVVPDGSVQHLRGSDP